MRSIFSLGLASAMLFVLPAWAAPNVFQDPLDVAAPASVAVAKQMLVAGRRTPAGRLVAVGRHGLIVTSDDGGADWKQSSVPVSSDLVAVDFPTPEQGWAVGHSGVVLHTSDGGLRWERQLDGRTLPDMLIAHYKSSADSGDPGAQRELKEALRYKKEGPSRPLFDVHFTDALHGMLVGAYNLALRTEDGGRTWVPISDLLDNPQGFHLYAIARVDDTWWVAGEQGLVLRQDPSTGHFMRLQVPYQGTLFGIAGKAGEVIVFGLRGNALRSRDAGANWTKLDTGTQNHLSSATVLADGRIVMASLAGELLVDPAGEDKLTPLSPALPQSIYSVSVASDDKLLLTGAGGVRVMTVGSVPPATAKLTPVASSSDTRK